MQAIMESLFDICYLVFAIGTGISLLRRNGGRVVRMLGMASLVLGCGDAFHLVPRVMDYWLRCGLHCAASRRMHGRRLMRRSAGVFTGTCRLLLWVR